MSGPLKKQDEFNQNLWYESYDANFIELSLQSRITASWLSSRPVYTKYAESGIMPLNNYVDNIGIQPELVKIDGNSVTLRQLAYADIYLYEPEGKDFFNVDRTWMRQYYQTKASLPDKENCFSGTYQFFVTWCPQQTTPIFYSAVEGSPVEVEAKLDQWFFPMSRPEFLMPHMVRYQFKRVGEHMYDDELGIIRRGMPLFDMTFSVDDIILAKIKEFYANN